ncbi:hypothetical protein [Rossellomorea sp. BNER]|uniref:hypothetical protein n=1 Tax=Rossellomorea sp. BNER TaxID=2962031 RepID=UPI003AF26281|nr:hypothetical protein [Rossellomorea sp. BNER]
MGWKDIKIENVDQIEKCVAEFEITALDFFENLYDGDILHYGAFKVKVYETQIVQFNPDKDFNFIGYTNLKLKDSSGGYEGGIGSGVSLEQALEETIRDFMRKLTEYKAQKSAGLCKEDFVLVDYDEF